MWFVRVKYRKQAIPVEYEFDTEYEAKCFCEYKHQHNPYVRWIEIDQTRQYPKQPLGKRPPIDKFCYENQTT